VNMQVTVGGVNTKRGGRKKKGKKGREEEKEASKRGMRSRFIVGS